ncbi:hypothetical protein BHE74_00035366 [Ensete ventricosum]|nr:hypothetical protein GW17_00011369 [Ensete ventricosum]RWW57819.1 hypothetical protein BHE74_00035366 [Ensete ventricosum]RZR86849.1 hypothetical protein BHM03_00014131 [Ensete ventricosum]
MLTLRYLLQIAAAFVDVSPEELVKNDPSDLKESTKATPAETQLVSTWHVTDYLIHDSLMLDDSNNVKFPAVWGFGIQ